MNELETEPKKKRKSNSNLIIFLIIIIIALILYFGLLKPNTDPTFTLTERISYFVIAVIIIFAFVGFSKTPKKFRVTTEAWIKTIFTHLVWPLMIFTIIILGVITEKYPPNYNLPQRDSMGIIVNNHTDPFNVGVNKSLNIMSGALSKAFYNIVMSLFDFGREHPLISIVLFLVFFAGAIFLMFHSVKLKVLENMEAQELIDDVSDKDYKDLERFEEKERQKKLRLKLKNNKI